MSRGTRVGAVARWALVVLVGLVIGAGSAALLLTGRAFSSGGEQIGAWSVNVDVGSDQGGRYVRAVTAVQGLLALSKQEAVYYVAVDDDAGRTLRSTCAYEIAGGDFSATWWSVTAYDDAYLADNGDDHPSVDATSAQREPDGSWTARLGATQDGATNWISTAGNDSVNLLLRLYVPEASVLRDPGSVAVPKIRRLGCEGDA